MGEEIMNKRTYIVLLLQIGYKSQEENAYNDATHPKEMNIGSKFFKGVKVGGTKRIISVLTIF